MAKTTVRKPMPPEPPKPKPQPGQVDYPIVKPVRDRNKRTQELLDELED